MINLSPTLEHICPKCGNKTFIVTAHITQDWKVDSLGNFIEVTEDCGVVTHTPNNDDIWGCTKCGHEATGKRFLSQSVA